MLARHLKNKGIYSIALFATDGPARWEGAIEGISQKTCLVRYWIWACRCTGENQNYFYPYIFTHNCILHKVYCRQAKSES